MYSEKFINTFAKAIATNEGFFVTEEDAKDRGIAFPTLAQKNNNPGNLRAWGYYPIENGYAHFPKPENGWHALNIQITLNITRGLTLYEFFAGKPGVYSGFAPAADKNRPKEYAEFVAGFLHKNGIEIEPDTILKTVAEQC